METPLQKKKYTVVIPCYNEEDAIEQTLNSISSDLGASDEYEIIVVNDGSEDRTSAILTSILNNYENLRVIDHAKNSGYGKALKTGIRNANSELIVITDADGTYPNERIEELVDLCTDHDMVVGSRTGENVVYSKIRAIPKYFLKKWVSWIAGREVPDINSGLRVFRKNVAERYFGILSDQFSFTITITLAMLTNSRSTIFVPIDYHPRVGRSKISPIKDTLRFIMIILRTGVYFAPLRAFAPIFGTLFCIGLASLTIDIVHLRDITDKTVLFFLFSMNIGMFALLADMIDKRSGN